MRICQRTWSFFFLGFWFWTSPCVLGSFWGVRDWKPGPATWKVTALPTVHSLRPEDLMYLESKFSWESKSVDFSPPFAQSRVTWRKSHSQPLWASSLKFFDFLQCLSAVPRKFRWDFYWAHEVFVDLLNITAAVKRLVRTVMNEMWKLQLLYKA